MKKIITVILNCVLILIGLMFIVGRFHIPAHTQSVMYADGLFDSRSLTLNQDITITNPNNDSKTLKKDSVIDSDMIFEKGALYAETDNGAYYHEYIPLDYFVEGDELKAELDEVVENNQTIRRGIMQDAFVKILCWSCVYLAIAIPVTIIPIKKKKFLVSVLINIILVLIVFTISGGMFGY